MPTAATVDVISEIGTTTARTKKISNDIHHYSVTPLQVQIPPPHLHQVTTSSMFHQKPSNLDPTDPSNLLQTQQPQATFSTSSGDFSQIVTEHHSDVKWLRHEICTPCNCICFFIAFIFLLTALMSGVYYGLNFFDGRQLRERVFKAQFVVRNQDFLSNELENSESNEFHMFSDMLKKKINNLFQQSMISASYVKTEIIAFERKRNSPSETIIHINIHVSTNKQPNVQASDIYLILAEEIINNRLKVFDSLMVDHNSIDVQERRWLPREKSSLTANPWRYKSMFPGMLEGLTTEPTPAPRKCGRIDLPYCQFLSYDQTSYPNFFNHWNVSSIEEEFILYKELIDSECYSLSKEFLCNLLQPECIADDMILPCQDFCLEFYNACRKWLPEKLMKKISCYTFPTKEQKSNRQCKNKPNCATVLRLQSQHHKLCDGIFDCQDHSDEMLCTYCDNTSVHFHCGDKQCIPLNLTCDNIRDCYNGADEIDCLRLTTFASSEAVSQTSITSQNVTNKMFTMMEIANEGYLEAISKGKHSFVCSDHSSTTNSNNMYNYSHSTYYDSQTPILGHNICNENHFGKLIRIESTHAIVNGHTSFTRFVPGTLPSPYPIQCKSKQVYYIECNDPKCGINHIPADFLSGFQSRKSFPGYWPWYVKININGYYYCDGTLISSDTILAQSTCFTNQRSLSTSNHNLTVTFGSVRMSHDNIEAKEYSISTINNHNILDYDQKLTFLKLDRPIKTSHIIRPICQKGDSLTWTSSHKCVIVNLNYELDVLQHRPVKIVNMEHCKRYLFSTVNVSIQTSTLPNSSSLPWLSTTKTLPMGNYNNKLCVEMHNNEVNYDTMFISNNNNNNNINNDNDATCKNCSMFGRHLYCLTKNQWNFLAIEYRTISLVKNKSEQEQHRQRHYEDKNYHDNDDEDKNLILFQIIPNK